MQLKNFPIRIALSLVISPLVYHSYARAEVLSDNTLPVPTQITQSEKVFEIKGGTATGNNLFHSFNTFSIQEQETAQFINNNTSIQNIIGRITGSSKSQILGKVATGGTSTNFNLFLINPNGIIFGPQSSLDINGSFVATTANSMQFGSEGSFGPFTGSDPSLLTVNPSAFLFNQTRPQPIVNQSIAGLTVPPNNSILLLGGTIEVNKGILNAPNGRIELGGLLEPGTVLLNVNQGIFSLTFPDNILRSNVSLVNESLVNVTDKGSGSVNIFAQNIILSGTSSIRAGISSELQSDTNNPGAIVLNATGAVTVKDIDSGILSLAGFGATGNSGDIVIIADSLNMESLSGIVSYTFGNGNSGNIILNIRRGVKISDSNEETSTLIASAIAPGGKGNSGDITIQAGSFSLSDGAGIRSSVFGEGNNGNISIRVDNDFTIENSTNYTSEIRTAVESGAVGNAGNIDVRAQTISLRSGGQISSSVSGPSDERQGGKGNGGSIAVSASDLVNISGTSVGNSEVRSGIFANTEKDADGISGNIVIKTNSFVLNKGAEIQLSNPQGEAGNLTVNTNSMTLNNGTIFATTGGDGANSSANIDLNISTFLKLENESLISAIAKQNENGGNIRIDSPIVLALFPVGPTGSDIVASAEFGKGGNIEINSQAILGLEERQAFDGNGTNDFDASSQFGLSGQVQINTTSDVNRGLVELPATVLDPNTIVSQHPCDRGWNSSFTLKGRGGNPQTPRQDLSPEAIQVGLVEPVPMPPKASEASNQNTTAQPFNNPAQPTAKPIVPAQGWVYNNKGEVLLVAYTPTLSAAQRLTQTPSCPAQ